jgi:FkbM family methyltransferase
VRVLGAGLLGRLGAALGRSRAGVAPAPADVAPADVAPAPAGVAAQVTREQVTWAYRILLDREPESELAIVEKVRAWTNTSDLRADIMASPEFRARNPKALLRPRESDLVIKLLPDGARLFVDLYDRVIGQAILLDEYEPDQLAFMRRHVRVGQVVVDVGAHIGRYALECAARVGPAGHVYAFEPVRPNAALLRQSIAESRFGDRVTLEERAVGEGPGTATIAYVEAGFNSGGAYLSSERLPARPNHQADPVEVVALDGYPFPRAVDFLKIDVEGAEALVLRGARARLARDRPVVLLELHPELLEPVSGCSPAALHDEVQALGYEWHALGPDGEPRPGFATRGTAPEAVALFPAGSRAGSDSQS